MLHSQKNPDFANFTSTLLNQKSRYAPLIELGIDPSIKQAILGRPVRTIQDDIEFMAGMGYDFIKIQPAINMDLNRTLVGTAGTSDRAWSAEGEGLITNWTEFEQYRWPQKEEIDYSRFEEARKIMPENMGIIGQYGDIFTTVWELMGFETFAMAVYEQPDLIAALFDRAGSLILSMFETMAEMDWVGVLWYSDDIAYSSNLMLSPDFYRQHFFPLLKHIGKLAATRRIPFIYHTDGVLWEVMGDITGSGVTALHPIEPKAMDIFEVQKKVGKKLCLCGGIEVDLLARGRPDEVIRLTNKFLDGFAGGGYCAGSSNSIPEYVTLANYLAMNETVVQRAVAG